MYIEYYIIENLLINYILITCTSAISKRYTPFSKKLIGSIIGSIYSVLYIFKEFEILFTIPFKILIMSAIILIVFGYRNIRDYIKISIIFYLVNGFISGSTFFIIYLTGIKHSKISFIIICVYISCELLKYIYKDIKMIRYMETMKKNIKVSLCGDIFEYVCLVDSGNLLKDPISNDDVVILSAKKLNNLGLDIDTNNINKSLELLDKRYLNRVRIIPYKNISNSNMILGLKADYIQIGENKISNIVLGITNFDENEYDAILSPSILQ